jgi:cell shape-determining protein MreC
LILFFSTKTRYFFADTLSSMFGLGNNLHDTIAQTPKSFSSKADLLAENTRLTEEMESLRLSLVDHEIIKEENNRLHFELGLKPVGKFISAKVVAKPPQIPLDSLLLNIGANDSVSVGDLVLASERVLIGRIVSVSGNTATAALSSFPDSVSYGYLARTNEALEVVGAGGHNVPLIKDDFGIRKLTPKECFAFQGYPVDEYVLPRIANSKLYMQAGNSVTTILIERIAKEILKVL